MNKQELENMNLSPAEMAGLVPKYLRLRQSLRQDIAKLEPGARLPSVAAIRARYQVSQSTFDRAIEGLRREGVIETHQGKGMFTTAAARCKRIGLIFGNDIFSSGSLSSQTLFQCLRQQTSAQQHLLYYFFSDPSQTGSGHGPRELMMEVEAGRLDGLLASAAYGVHEDGWDHLSALGLPFVAFARRGRLANRVCLDFAAMIRMGTSALADQGCRRLALWHRNPHQRQEKAEIFADALAAAGASTHETWNVVVPSDTEAAAATATEFEARWASWDEKPDGIVCTDDVMTRGLLDAANRMGIAIPETLTIASHANRGISPWGETSVLRVEFDLNEVATAMLERLERLMNGQHIAPDVLSIEPHVVLPSTCE